MASAMTLEEALPQVLKKAKYQSGVKKGLREVVKYLDKRAAHLCILAKDCDEPQYSRLVEALCTLHSIPLLKVDSNQTLGQWVGQCKYDETGNARKVVKCSCAVIIDFGEESEALSVVNEHIGK
ncbi:small ribosomal subunit protein eS12-like [Convolutriloba macropyga]|uniref:small ribosomal subunit protein eS12-like n=1 Tax=Convolutriloba macropyga TaxID=536237 RepID=UPI003F51D529